MCVCLCVCVCVCGCVRRASGEASTYRGASRWEHLGKGHFITLGQLSHELLRQIAGDERHVRVRWRAQDGSYQLKLLHIVLTLEQRLRAQQLRKHTADGPDVHCRGVVLSEQVQPDSSNNNNDDDEVRQQTVRVQRVSDRAGGECVCVCVCARACVCVLAVPDCTA